MLFFTCVVHKGSNLSGKLKAKFAGIYMYHSVSTGILSIKYWSLLSLPSSIVHVRMCLI